MLNLRTIAFFIITLLVLIVAVVFFLNRTSTTRFNALETAQRNYVQTGAVSSTNTVTTINASGTQWNVVYSPTTDSSVSVILENPNGTGPFTWTLSAGALPPGMSIINGLDVLDANGNPTGEQYSIIVGRPEQAGTYSFDLEVTDANGNSQISSFTLTIDSPPTIRVCADGSIPNSPCAPTHSISLTSGNHQVGVKGQELKNKLKVTVAALPAATLPSVAGVGVAWKVVRGNGKFKTWITTTDATGSAEAQFILDTVDTFNSVEASLYQGGSTTFPKPVVTFDFQGRPPNLSKTNDNQTIVLYSSTKKPMILKVTDKQNQPMEGVKVEWTAVPASDGSTVNIFPDKNRQKVGASFTDANGDAKAIVGSADLVTGTYNIRAKLPKYNVEETFTVVITTPGFLHARDNVLTLVPGDSLNLIVCYDQAPPNPPPNYISIPVTFRIESGDGTLAPNPTVGTDGVTCIGTVRYTFGLDGDPDIVSATGAGETVYFSMTPPNVEVTRIEFRDNYDIRENVSTDIPQTQPEWVENDVQMSDNNYAVAFPINHTVRLKVRIKADAKIRFATFEAKALVAGSALQDIPPTFSLTPDFAPSSVNQAFFTVSATTAASIGKNDIRWIWKVSDINGGGSTIKNSTASGPHTVYTLLSTPALPFTQAWTEALDHATSNSWGGGSVAAPAAASSILNKIYYSIGFEYELKGRPSYGSRGTFDLTKFLARLRDGGAKECNCFDAAHTMVTLLNILGTNSRAINLESTKRAVYYLSRRPTIPISPADPNAKQTLPLLNLIDPIGQNTKPTNNINPMDPTEPGVETDKRTGGFQNHLYVKLNGNVYDPTLKVSMDSPRNGTPNEFTGSWTYTLPDGMVESTYLNRLFDDIPLQVNDIDHDNDGTLDTQQADNTAAKTPITITLR